MITQAIILDTETTDSEDPGLLEAAWIGLDFTEKDGFLFTGETFHSRYNPGKPIKYGAKAVHHILEEDLIDCPPPSEFTLPPTVQYIIGHNVDFDWKAIGSPSIKRICTLALSRRVWDDEDSHTLGACIYRIFEKEARPLLRDSHSAWTDATLCLKLLLHITKVFPPKTLDHLWRMSEKARIPIRMPFGEHRGKKLVDVPESYLRWVVSKSDMDPYLLLGAQEILSNKC